jgi:hypothetical protein
VTLDPSGFYTRQTAYHSRNAWFCLLLQGFDLIHQRNSLCANRFKQGRKAPISQVDSHCGIIRSDANAAKVKNITGFAVRVSWLCVSVADLLERLPDTTTVHQVISAARCSKCGQRGDVKTMRIAFGNGLNEHV